MSNLRLKQIYSSVVSKIWDIDNANTARTTSTVVGAVQVVDQTGKVPPAGDAVGNAPFVKITDGTDTIDVVLVNGLNSLNTNIGYRPTVSNASSGLVTIDTTATGVTIVASNLLRTKIIVQNQGNIPVLLKFDGNVSTSDYDLILAAATGTRTGDGGSYESFTWKGAIKGITETSSSIISILEEETT
jgi:hypothetical protein